MALTKVNAQLISGGGMTTDTTGNVTFSQAAIFSYSANSNYATDGAISNYSSTNGVYLNGNSAGWLRLAGDGTSSTNIQINGSTYSDPNKFVFTTAGVTRMTLDASGRVLVGTTNTTPSGSNVYGVVIGDAGNGTAYAGVIQASANGNSALILNRGADSGSTVVFRQAGTSVGSISVTGSATAYNTSSDYRLKEDIAPMTDALIKVSALKPVTYKWKSDGSDGQGFIAHELAQIVPDCVTGEKDAVDAEGNPSYQGIDVSFLVATLTAAIQELNAKVTALETQLAAK